MDLFRGGSNMGEYKRKEMVTDVTYECPRIDVKASRVGQNMIY
jgi:hypothetical protein